MRIPAARHDRSIPARRREVAPRLDPGAGAAAALAVRRSARRPRARCRGGRGRAAPRARAPRASGRPAPSSSARRSESIVSWGKAASASAIASARATCSPAATTSVTSPMRSASSTSTMRPLRRRSSARPLPTIRGSRCVPPSISGTPKRRSVKPKRALGVATRRSHHSASSKPPARHQPEIAAIVGFGEASRVKPSGPSGRSSRGPSVSSAFRSAPAQNASSPAAGQHEHARLVVGDEAPEGLVQRLGGRAVDRVAALGPVDRDERGGAGALVATTAQRRATSRRAGRRARGAPWRRALRASLRLSRRRLGACSARR